MASRPEIAVVIPTRGREARLAFALESLRGQLDPERFEVIVVRDRDAPGPYAEPPAPLTVRNLQLPGAAGPAAKRNLGWRASSAPLIAFTDDDCRPAPGWLATLLAGADGDAAFLQGPTEPDPDELHLLHGLARSVRVERPTGWFETSNMAYPRPLLERLGGFDERLDFGGEDTDLGWRAIEAGAEARFVAGAVVRHAVVSRSVPDAFRDAVRWRDTAAVLARHPQLHDRLHRRHFWNRAHFGLALGVAGTALAGRSRPLAAAAWLPYLGTRLNWREPRPRGLLRQLLTLPVIAALDVTETVARLPSAIRHRVPVL